MQFMCPGHWRHDRYQSEAVHRNGVDGEPFGHEPLDHQEPFPDDVPSKRMVEEWYM